MQDRLPHLSIKITSLAAEARIIKTAEQRLKRRARKVRVKLKAAGHVGELPYDQAGVFPRNRLREDQQHHRLYVVRPEARAALLAMAFLKARPYSTVEASTRTAPNWARVEELVKAFGIQQPPEWRHSEQFKLYEKEQKDQADRLAGWLKTAQKHQAKHQLTGPKRVKRERVQPTEAPAHT